MSYSNVKSGNGGADFSLRWLLALIVGSAYENSFWPRTPVLTRNPYLGIKFPRGAGAVNYRLKIKFRLYVVFYPSYDLL